MINKSKKILAEISPGELLDKISILEIKVAKIKDKKSQEVIRREYEVLMETKKLTIEPSPQIDELYNKIKIVNLDLWNVEDKIRICEKDKKFKDLFIKLAREVYFKNDERAKIKREINEILDSNFKEIKQYVKY